MTKVLVLSLALLFSSHRSLADFKNADQASAHAYIDNQSNLVFSKVSVDFSLIMNERYEPTHILKFKTSSSVNLAVEGASTESNLELFKLQKSGTGLLTGDRIWESKTEGDQIRQKWNFIEATISGCCGSSDTHYLISLKDGKKVLSYLDNQIYRVNIPNSKTIRPRYVAVINEFKDSKLVRGGELTNLTTLVYTDESGTVLDKLHLLMIIPSGQSANLSETEVFDFQTNGKTAIRNQEVELWASDQSEDANSAFRGFGFKGSFTMENKRYHFLIPIVDNQFSLRHGRLTPGLTAER